MSTALITALRESCGYLRDGGYHQTARLVAMAADEIEQLNQRALALQSGAQTPASGRRTIDRHGEIATARAGQADLPPERRGVSANR
jgi:hypothetical protein